MSVTYNLDNDVGKVRLIIQDGASSESSIQNAAIYQDDDIQAFLDLEGGARKLAAAQALDAMASSEAMVMKRITLLALKTDGPATAAELRKHAQMLRDQYAAGQTEEGGLFDWAEQTLSPWSTGEILLKDRMRTG